ncbi:MAG: sugar porter family MFS transporter, partial [Saprospiraceae bacterium]|nr:sugar porter family MFS transporter [Saprospiraceae bacterium]
MKPAKNKSTQIAIIVALGGFLFGFDASVISGVTSFIVPEFNLNAIQKGWAVASLTLTSTLAMLTAGPLSDRWGRKPVLLLTGFLFALSALGSALAPTFNVLILARLIGGLAVGASLILAPIYIAEMAPSHLRGRLVSINQLNIVLGFSAAYFSNYYFLSVSQSDISWVSSLGIDTDTWRWMLGIEMLPAILYSLLMIRIPESPRWLFIQGRTEEAQRVFHQITPHEDIEALKESILASSQAESKKETLVKRIIHLGKPAFRTVLMIGLIIGILQQITGVNAIYFYAPSIFEQSGVGRNAAFAQAVWVGIINVIGTLIAMVLIDRTGRKSLLVIGLLGVTISLLLAAWGFQQATYQLDQEQVAELPLEINRDDLEPILGMLYQNDLQYKSALNRTLGETVVAKHEADLIQAAILINPRIVLIGILGFVASFA